VSTAHISFNKAEASLLEVSLALKGGFVMAERTKFITYCIYSAVISGIIYPIEAHWTWGNSLS